MDSSDYEKEKKELTSYIFISVFSENRVRTYDIIYIINNIYRTKYNIRWKKNDICNKTRRYLREIRVLNEERKKKKIIIKQSVFFKMYKINVCRNWLLVYTVL